MLVSIIPTSVSAQEKVTDCLGLPQEELSNCIEEVLKPDTQFTDVQEQSNETVSTSANATAVTSNETISAGEYGNFTRFEYANELNGRMANHLGQLLLFGEACSDYARLKVQEETDKCIMVVGEINKLIVDLKERYDVVDKNIAVGANSQDLSPDMLPSPSVYCNSYEVYAGMTDEQCQKTE
jgi:hypothetical protein